MAGKVIVIPPADAMWKLALVAAMFELVIIGAGYLLAS